MKLICNFETFYILYFIGCDVYTIFAYIKYTSYVSAWKVENCFHAYKREQILHLQREVHRIVMHCCNIFLLNVLVGRQKRYQNCMHIFGNILTVNYLFASSEHFLWKQNS